MDVIKTKAKVLVDGFGGMAVTSLEATHKYIIQNLHEESVWEVFDGVEKKPKGEYIVTLQFWWESNFPESGDSLIIETVGQELVTPTG